MSHYSDDSSMVRVDFFKESDKWYTTEAVKWTGGYSNCLINEAFYKSLHDHLWQEETKRYRLSGMRAVCLFPYHEHEFPLCVLVDDIARVINNLKENSQ